VAYAFRASVGGFILTPLRLLFLSYPKQVENHDLRSHPRIDYFLPANLAIGGMMLAGPFTNLGRDGCALLVEPKRDSEPGRFIEETATVHLQLPGENRYRPVDGQVRSARQNPHGTLFGIQFRLDPTARRRLYAYLLTVGALPEHGDFSAVLAQHLLWLGKVNAFLEGRLPQPPAERAENECAFGQWFYGEANGLYAGMPQSRRWNRRTANCTGGSPHCWHSRSSRPCHRRRASRR